MKKPVLILLFLLSITSAYAQKRFADTTIYGKGFDKKGEPVFPGGVQALNDFLFQHLRYPPKAYNNGIQGTTNVKVIVEKDGSLGRFKIVKSISPEIDKEVLRVLQLSPKWKPAVRKQQIVRSYTAVKVTFKITPPQKIRYSGKAENEIFAAEEKFPEPEIGFENYYRYINDKALSIHVAEGTVLVQFVVNRDSTLSNFDVIGKLTPKADTTAIQLITNGPRWLPAEKDGRKAKRYATVAIKFGMDTTFTAVEHMPDFLPWGMFGFKTFIAANMRRPATELPKGADTVLVEVVISRNGDLCDLKVIKSISPEFDKEAIRLIGLSAKWKPGTQGGRPLPVRFTLPISFSTNTIITNKPQFPGGWLAFRKFLQKKLKYPDEYITGSVFVSFTVKENGKLIDPKIEKGLTKAANAEALRLIKKSPKWIPAILNNKPVQAITIVPINFTIGL